MWSGLTSWKCSETTSLASHEPGTESYQSSPQWKCPLTHPTWQRGANNPWLKHKLGCWGRVEAVFRGVYHKALVECCRVISYDFYFITRKIRNEYEFQQREGNKAMLRQHGGTKTTPHDPENESEGHSKPKGLQRFLTDCSFSEPAELSSTFWIGSQGMIIYISDFRPSSSSNLCFYVLMLDIMSSLLLWSIFLSYFEENSELWELLLIKEACLRTNLYHSDSLSLPNYVYLLWTLLAFVISHIRSLPANVTCTTSTIPSNSIWFDLVIVPVYCSCPYKSTHTFILTQCSCSFLVSTTSQQGWISYLWCVFIA